MYRTETKSVFCVFYNGCGIYVKSISVKGRVIAYKRFAKKEGTKHLLYYIIRDYILYYKGWVHLHQQLLICEDSRPNCIRNESIYISSY